MEENGTPGATAPAPEKNSGSIWQTQGANVVRDPLLQALADLTGLFGRPWTVTALGADLPKVNGRLSPAIFPRAADRAGLDARLVEISLDHIQNWQLPALLLLNEQQACLLLNKTSDGQYTIKDVTGGATLNLSQTDLAAQYTGLCFFIRPRFKFEARTPEVANPTQRHWFWGAIWDNWRLYRDALLAALFINILSLAIPLYSMNVYDRVAPNQAIETLWALSIGTGLALLFNYLMSTLRSYMIDLASKRVDVNLSIRIMQRVLGLKMEARPASVGSFAANLRSFEAIRDFITSATITGIIDLPFALLFIAVLAWISPWYVLPILLTLIAVILIGLALQQKIHEISETTYRASAQRNAVLIESLTGIETLKTLNATSMMQQRWEEVVAYIAAQSSKSRLLANIANGFVQFIGQFQTIILMVIGIYLLSDAKMTLGGMIAASQLAGRAIYPFGQLMGLMMQYHDAKNSLTSLESHMTSPQERPANAPFVERPEFKGGVEFKELDFAYPNEKQPTLKGLNIQIQPGERIGIIGRMGSGKTTLNKLLLGLYTPSEGAVLLDGIDTRQIDPIDIREAVAHIPQDVLLFYGSLKDNLALGRPHVDDAAILAAAELAGLTEYVNRHPRGFDMQIGERGEGLSGGQKQAVAIARALIGNPAIVLLDEPTSGMDHQSEDQFKARLREWLGTRTMLLVTHRTSLLELVNRLIVIDNGRVVADGPKAQVMEALKHGRISRAQ